jgi:hypothetical protein
LQLDGKHALTGLGIGLLLPRDAALAALGLAADHLPVLIRFRDALRSPGNWACAVLVSAASAAKPAARAHALVMRDRACTVMVRPEAGRFVIRSPTPIVDWADRIRRREKAGAGQPPAGIRRSGTDRAISGKAK